MPLLGYDPDRPPLREASTRVKAHAAVSKKGNVYHVDSYDRKVIASALQKISPGRSGPDRVALPDGTTIHAVVKTTDPIRGTRKQGFQAHRPQTDSSRVDSAPTTFSAEAAADSARKLSARSKEGSSLGGTRVFGSAEDAEKGSPPGIWDGSGDPKVGQTVTFERKGGKGKATAVVRQVDGSGIHKTFWVDFEGSGRWVEQDQLVIPRRSSPGDRASGMKGALGYTRRQAGQ